MGNPELITQRYQELAVAIVAQACEDYCMSRRAIKAKKSAKDIEEAFKENNACLDFFNSDNFRLFSNFEMPTAALLDRLDYLADNDPRQFIRFYIPRAGSEDCSTGEDY